MNQSVRFGQFNILPPVVKNLLIINLIFFIASLVSAEKFGFSLTRYLGLHYWTSEFFKPHQILTHMFMHGDFGHIFSNMFALWMFGSVLENVWGSKRFLFFYLVTGLGAAIIHNVFKAYDIHQLIGMMNPDAVAIVKAEGWEVLNRGMNYTDPLQAALNISLNAPSVGASGAVFGLLLAFGMLFPNTYLYLYFAIPVKAKYFVIGYGLLELFLGWRNVPGDNVAHFAHLGGMLFGFILIKIWNKTRRNTLY